MTIVTPQQFTLRPSLVQGGPKPFSQAEETCVGVKCNGGGGLLIDPQVWRWFYCGLWYPYYGPNFVRMNSARFLPHSIIHLDFRTLTTFFFFWRNVTTQIPLKYTSKHFTDTLVKVLQFERWICRKIYPFKAAHDVTISPREFYPTPRHTKCVEFGPNSGYKKGFNYVLLETPLPIPVASPFSTWRLVKYT